MENAQQDTVLFRILRNENGGWDVLESDVEAALASFNDRQDACDYANQVAGTKEGATVLVLDESKLASAAHRSTLQR